MVTERFHLQRRQTHRQNATEEGINIIEKFSELIFRNVCNIKKIHKVQLQDISNIILTYFCNLSRNYDSSSLVFKNLFLIVTVQLIQIKYIISKNEKT